MGISRFQHAWIHEFSIKFVKVRPYQEHFYITDSGTSMVDGDTKVSWFTIRILKLGFQLLLVHVVDIFPCNTYAISNQNPYYRTQSCVGKRA